MKINLKIKKEKIFTAIGILLFLLIIIFVFYSINFLTGNLEDVLGSRGIESGGNIGFNLEGLKQLGIMK